MPRELEGWMSGVQVGAIHLGKLKVGISLTGDTASYAVSSLPQWAGLLYMLNHKECIILFLKIWWSTCMAGYMILQWS